MKRLLLAIILSAGAANAASADTLKVYNWSEYIDPAVIAEFEQETGISVVYDEYENGETTEAMLMAGGTGYDLVVVSSEYAGRLISAGVVQPMDPSQLANARNLWRDITERTARIDPGNRFTVPYLWGTTGIGYDSAAVAERMPDAPLGSWAMLFDPKVVARFADCGISMIDAPEEVLSAALIYLGHDPNSTDPEEILEAQATIAAVSPYVKTFDSEQIHDLANGRICLALSWSGDALNAADQAVSGVEIAYSIPEEGALTWFDLFVIPADSGNVAAAHRFLDFLLRPEVIARCSNFTWYANGNAAATALVDEEVLSNPVVYPPEDAMARLMAIGDRTPAEKRAIAKAWTRLKLGL